MDLELVNFLTLVTEFAATGCGAEPIFAGIKKGSRTMHFVPVITELKVDELAENH